MGAVVQNRVNLCGALFDPKTVDGKYVGL